MTTPALDELTSEALVTLDLQSADVRGAIDEMAALLEADGRVTDRPSFVDAAVAREESGPTGMEMGIAIPHAKSSAVTRASVVFGRSSTGVDFKAPDGTPAELVFLIAVPDDAADLHVTLLSRLARKLVHSDFRESLRAAATPADAIATIRKGVTL
jgi:fructose-specific phosphotransferase system IIA component